LPKLSEQAPDPPQNIPRESS